MQIESSRNPYSPPPEDESIRMKKLRNVLKKAVDSALHTISEEVFQKNFPEISSEHMKSAHEQISHFLRDSIESEFEVILEHRHLKSKLYDLDQLLMTTPTSAHPTSSTIVPMERPSPEAIVLGKTIPLKENERQHLLKELSQVEQKVNHLKTSIEHQRQWIEDFQKTFLIKTKELKKFSSTLDKIPPEEFDRTVWM